MPEISAEELKVLQGSKALLDKLLANPKTKRTQEKLVKEVYPEAVTTDDVLEPVLEEVKAIGKRFDEYVKTQEGSKLDSKLNQDISYLRKERDFTDEGIETLKKLMVEKQIPDIVVAADHWERQNPPKVQEPSILGPTSWGFGHKTEDTDLGLLYSDEDAWAEKEATRVWNEEVKKRGQIVT
jgi:hypothetical protein